jgi:hypothetical protein
MLPQSLVFPRNCSVFGTENSPSLLVSTSIINTCGVLVFETPDGNEFYIFTDGLIPSMGGVNEVMIGGIGSVGTALGPAITPAPPTVPLRDGMSVLGSQRVSSSIFIASNKILGRSGALAMMTGNGLQARFLYLTSTGANTWRLNLGTENQYLSGSQATLVGSPVVGSGALGMIRLGRTIIQNTRGEIRNAPVAFIISAGRGAGFGFEFGGENLQGNGMIMYFPESGVPLFVTPDQWWAWNQSVFTGVEDPEPPPPPEEQPEA